MKLRDTLSALPRWQKWALATAIVVALYGLFGFLVAPGIVRSQAEQALRDRFDREARIGEVRINPFLLTLTARDFALPDRDGSPFLRFEELGVDFELSSIFRGAYTFGEIRLVAPFVHIKIREDGSLNAADLAADEGADPAAPPDAPEEESGPPPVLVGLASIERGQIVFSDFSHPTPFEHEIAPLAVELRDFGTRPDDESPYSFSATTGAGEALEWQGNLSVVPLYSAGRFALTGLRPRTGWLYVQDTVTFEIVDGTVDVEGVYDLDSREGLRVRLDDGAIRVRDFALAERETGALAVRLPELDVDGLSVTYPEQRVGVAEITSRGGEFALLRYPDGQFRAQRLASGRRVGEPGAESEPDAVPPSDADEPAAEADWDVEVQTVRLRDHRIDFEDGSTDPAVRLSVDVLGLDLQNVTNDLTRPIEAAVQLGLGEAGRISIDGPLRADPPRVDVELEIADVDLGPFEPYWAPALAIDVSSGRVGLDGRLVARGETGDAPQVEFDGNLRVDALKTLDKLMSTDLFSWSALALEGIELDVSPTALKIGRVTLREPAAHVVVAPDGTVNLATIVVEQPTRPAASENTPPESGSPSAVEIGVVELVDGTLDFEDRTVSPRFRTGIEALAGTVEGLSSTSEARATVALSGELDGASPMKIDGVVSPLAPVPYLDLRLGFQNYGLSPFTPYSGRFIGKTIERGKLFLDLDYELANNHLVGANKVFLDQFTLGASVDSPDATDLPVGLAIALLKDRNGEIRIDLPIEGDVDDPDFSLGRLVLGAVRNLVTKIAMSPFSMLGGIAGGDDDSMSAVAFAPGSDALDGAEIEKLGTLAAALAERPAVSLELAGEATVELDRPALQAAALESELRRRRFQELQSKWFGDKPTSLDDVVLAPEDRSRLIERVFEERFGDDASALPPVSAGGGTNADPSADGPAALETARLEEMTSRLRAAVSVDDVALRDLARRRATTVRDHLVDDRGVAAERVFVLDPDVHEAATQSGSGAAMSLAAH